ncbi:MAG: thymidylate synthase [bacterium]
MKQYLGLINEILEFGVVETNRTGVDAKAIFGYQYRCRDVAEQFPLLTTKDVNFRSVAIELLWKLSGSTNIKPLVDQGVGIWNEWPFQNWLEKTGKALEYPKYSPAWKDEKKLFARLIKANDNFATLWGDLGPTYGHHMRHFGQVIFKDLPKNLQEDVIALHGNINPYETYIVGIDQISKIIETIKTNPDDRRMIMTLWNPHDNSKTLLPPCPCFYQFRVLGGKLHLQMYQRSCDTFLGVPFNTAQDSLLLLLVAQACGLPAGDFIHTFGDVHIYINHMEQVKEQITREPRPLPKVILNPEIKNIFDFTLQDITLTGYDPHPALKGDVAV